MQLGAVFRKKKQVDEKNLYLCQSEFKKEKEKTF
jgi:hypothetical protein